MLPPRLVQQKSPGSWGRLWTWNCWIHCKLVYGIHMLLKLLVLVLGLDFIISGKCLSTHCWHMQTWCCALFPSGHPGCPLLGLSGEVSWDPHESVILQMTLPTFKKTMCVLTVRIQGSLCLLNNFCVCFLTEPSQSVLCVKQVVTDSSYRWENYISGGDPKLSSKVDNGVIILTKSVYFQAPWCLWYATSMQGKLLHGFRVSCSSNLSPLACTAFHIRCFMSG